MSFIEVRLLDNISGGFSGGPTWKTRRIGLRNGIERRNVDRSRPLNRFQGSWDRREEDVLDTLIEAFNATAGSAYGFRFKNWMDYRAINQPLGAATGSDQSVQLVKTYPFGTMARTVAIRKPNDDVTILAGGIEIASSVDTTTGIVTFTGNPGDPITWAGTFDIPVIFDSDEFMGTIEETHVHTVSVALSEDLSA